MTPCFAIDEIVTPKKFVLRGLWLGPKKPKRIVVWVHGLGSSLWSKFAIAEQLVDSRTAVLVFNNRGADRVVEVGQRVGRKGKRITAGATHEKFTDCVDDIQGAINYARKEGVKNIYLAGHSTGCQKSIYWAHKKKSRGVNRIILLAPVSDYAGALANHGKAKIARAAASARALVKRGKPHEMLGKSVWSEEPNDAQRFLSLYTPDSIEEIFTYAQPKKNPRILKSIRKPLLLLWAERDEYADRPAEEAIAWFERYTPKPHKIIIVPGAKHSFKGAERRVANEIKKFINA